MQPDKFRQIALSMPEAFESSHMGHVDFRVADRIFATLGSPEEGFGMVGLPVDEQAIFLADYPAVFLPAKGAWGRAGSTLVRLEKIDGPLLRRAMTAAWQKRAPKRLLAPLE